MPNFKQRQSLIKKYNKASVLEGFDVNRKIEKSFSFTNLKDDKQFVDTFLLRKKHEVVLLYIDIANFTSQYGHLTTVEVSEFLDSYYNKVIPLIYRSGGEVERLTGDGIICVFGEPFYKFNRVIQDNALSCAKQIICECIDEDFPVKIAFHYGEIMYYQPPTEDFQEYTMIGNTLTELYRLESVSKVNAISFYQEIAPFDRNNLRTISNQNKNSYEWIVTYDIKSMQSFGERKVTFCSYNREYKNKFIGGGTYYLY